MMHTIITAENFGVFKNVFPYQPNECATISSLLNGKKATSSEGLRALLPVCSTLICARSFACAHAAQYLCISKG